MLVIHKLIQTVTWYALLSNYSISLGYLDLQMRGALLSTVGEIIVFWT